MSFLQNFNAHDVIYCIKHMFDYNHTNTNLLLHQFVHRMYFIYSLNWEVLTCCRYMLAYIILMKTVHSLYEHIFWSNMHVKSPLDALDAYVKCLSLWRTSQLQCHITGLTWTHFQHVYLPGRAVDCELRAGWLVSVNPRAGQKVNNLSRSVPVCVCYIYLRTMRTYMCNVYCNKLKRVTDSFKLYLLI